MNTQRLKGKRVEQNLTQKQMAEKLGISRLSYALKENGEREFSFDEVIRMASILGVNNLNFFYNDR